MDIHSLPIISEVYGEEGSGRSSFCFHITKYSTSLWIEAYPRMSTKRAYSLRMDLGSIYIHRTKNINQLISSLKEGEIQNFVKDHKIEIVIVNGLQDLEEIEITRENNYVELVKKLKKLYLTLRVKSILITSLPESYTRCTQSYIAQEFQETKSTIDRRDFLLQEDIKQPARSSAIKSTEWEYFMPAKLYIKRTCIPSIRIVEVVKPKALCPLKYILKIDSTVIHMETIQTEIAP